MGGKNSKAKAKQEADAAVAATPAASTVTPNPIVPSSANVPGQTSHVATTHIPAMENVPVNDEILKAGDYVTTPYGTGTVEKIRDDGVVIVRPDTWQLDRNKIPTFYMNRNAVHKSAVTLHSFNIGDFVRTPYGTGFVTETRPDGVIVVRPDTWVVAGDHKPFFFMNASTVTRATNAGVVNSFTVGDYVDSLYGTGFVTEIRKDNMVIVRPDTWRLAHNQAPFFYLWAPAVHKTVVSHEVVVGDLANTPYGVCRITELRADGMVVARPETWEVAGGHKPFFYMLHSAVSKATNSHGNRYIH